MAKDDFRRMADERGLLVLKNNFAMNLGDAFCNVAARKNIETRFAKELQRLTEEAHKLSERTDEDPALAEDVRAFVEANKAEVMAHVSGPIGGLVFDHRAAVKQLNDLVQRTHEQFRPRFELAEKRLEIRQDILRKGGVFDHVERAKLACGKVLSSETLQKLHELVTRPQGELKKQVAEAVDAHLKGINIQSQGISTEIKIAFDQELAKLLAEEEKAGADIIKAQQDDYRAKAESFFTPHEMQRFDVTVEAKMNSSFVSGLGKTYIGAKLFLTKSESQKFEAKLDTLRTQFALKGGHDETCNYNVMGWEDGDNADVRKFLTENIGRLAAVQG